LAFTFTAAPFSYSVVVISVVGPFQLEVAFTPKMLKLGSPFSLRI
jgi:hypothetical protein